MQTTAGLGHVIQLLQDGRGWGRVPYFEQRPAGVGVGGPEVMRAQLARLLEASEHPDIGIRVVPRAPGAHAGSNGSFKILSGPAGEFAYTESPGGGRLVPAAAEVKSFAIKYDRIGIHALPEAQSRDMIKQAMEAMR